MNRVSTFGVLSLLALLATAAVSMKGEREHQDPSDKPDYRPQERQPLGDAGGLDYSMRLKSQTFFVMSDQETTTVKKLQSWPWPTGHPTTILPTIRPFRAGGSHIDLRLNVQRLPEVMPTDPPRPVWPTFKPTMPTLKPPFP